MLDQPPVHMIAVFSEAQDTATSAHLTPTGPPLLGGGHALVHILLLCARPRRVLTLVNHALRVYTQTTKKPSGDHLFDKVLSRRSVGPFPLSISPSKT